jgi:hypothetical protein
MRIGTDISVLAEPGRPDSSVLAEHLALADLAEPLGFDSLFSLEHHFTGYSMSPSPLQLLAYYAAKTTRITLGTCVIVLPWQDPIRVAEQIAYLDLLCRGRCIFGFGRGAASVEYAGFRVSMEEARAICRGGTARDQGVARRGVRVGWGVLQNPPHVDTAEADVKSRAALLCVVGQSRICRDHGETWLRDDGGHAKRMEESRRRYREFP